MQTSIVGYSRFTNRLRRSIAVLIAVLFMATPLTQATTAEDDNPITVVATFSVLADIVEQVGGDQVEVTSLLPVGADPHTFDPSPDQIVALGDADVIVEVGNDFEPWLDDLVETSGSSATRVEAFPAEHSERSEEATPADSGDHDDEADEHADDEHADHEGELHEDHDGLHAWLNVHTTIHTVEHLADVMTNIDPDNADVYLANADAYTAKLEELDAYIIEQTESLPADQRELITSHQTFGPFADAYGYEIVGVLMESSTEGADASAGHLANLITLVEENDIPAVFPDTPGGEEMLQPLADDAGIEVAPQLYVDTLGEPGSGAETYIDMMRYNVDTIVAALGE